MRAVLVHDSVLIHIAARYRRNETACLIEGSAAFDQTSDLPTCPFCIRDGQMTEDVRDDLARRIGLRLEKKTE